MIYSMYFRGTISLRTTAWEVCTTYDIFYVFQRYIISPDEDLGGLYDGLYILCISEVQFLSVRRLGRFLGRMIYSMYFRGTFSLRTTTWEVYMMFYIFYVFQRYIISPYDDLGGLYDV